MLDEWSESDLNNVLAVALLDGWGEEVPRLLSRVDKSLHNLMRVGGAKIGEEVFERTSQDYEAFQSLNPRSEPSETDLAKIEAAFRRIAER